MHALNGAHFGRVFLQQLYLKLHFLIWKTESDLRWSFDFTTSKKHKCSKSSTFLTFVPYLQEANKVLMHSITTDTSKKTQRFTTGIRLQIWCHNKPKTKLTELDLRTVRVNKKYLLQDTRWQRHLPTLNCTELINLKNGLPQRCFRKRSMRIKASVHSLNPLYQKLQCSPATVL